MRRVSTLVLPEPAPATMSSDGPRYSTASRCRGLSPSSSSGSMRAPRGPGSDGSSTIVMTHQSSHPPPTPRGRTKCRNGVRMAK